MFQFPAFPIARSNCEGIPIRRSWVLSLHAAPPGLSQLGTSFVGARAEPFTRRLSSHAVRSLFPNELGPVDVWIARTYGLICTPKVGGACINPSHPRLHGVVHRFSVLTFERRHPLKGCGFERARNMDPLGFEPRASALQRRRSATELWAHPPVKEVIVR